MMSIAARVIRATLAVAFFALGIVPAVATEHPAAPRYATVMRTFNPALDPARSLRYAESLLANAERMHVDPTVVMALVTVESAWRERAVSIHGAQGLGQLKPGTARLLGVDANAPDDNLRGVATYLHRLLGLFSATREPLRAAVAGYNAGPYAIGREGQIPHNGQTPHYVVKVFRTLDVVRERLRSLELAAVKAAPATGALDADGASLGASAAALDRSEASYWSSEDGAAPL